LVAKKILIHDSEHQRTIVGHVTNDHRIKSNDTELKICHTN